MPTGKGKRHTPEQIVKKFKSSDKPPYAIPFPNQDETFVLEPSFYAFADSLRQRQEGERKVLDPKRTRVWISSSTSQS